VRGSDRATLIGWFAGIELNPPSTDGCTNFINTSANAFSDPMLLPVTPVRLTGSMEYEQNIFQKKRDKNQSKQISFAKQKCFRRGLR
jgi:hypothetical protein